MADDSSDRQPAVNGDNDGPPANEAAANNALQQEGAPAGGGDAADPTAPAAPAPAAPPLVPVEVLSTAATGASEVGAAPPAAAGARPPQSLTFSWTSAPVVQGHYLFYTSFTFCETNYM